jgi:hypothetical protein
MGEIGVLATGGLIFLGVAFSRGGLRDTHSEGFSYLVTSIAAPAASGWSVAGWDLHPLESAALPRRTPQPDKDRIEMRQCSKPLTDPRRSVMLTLPG